MRTRRSREEGGCRPSLPFALLCACCLGILTVTSADRLFQTTQEGPKSDYDIVWADSSAPLEAQAVYQAANRAQNLNAYFRVTGVSLVPHTQGAPAWELGLDVTGYGFGHETTSAGGAQLSPSGSRVEYSFSGALIGWYINGERGLEQGLTLAAPPEKHKARTAGPTHVDFALTGGLAVDRVDERGVGFSTANGWPVLRYSLARVTGAAGKELPARLEILRDPQGSPSGIRVLVMPSDAGSYPITVELLATSPKLEGAEPQAVATQSLEGEASPLERAAAVPLQAPDAGESKLKGEREEGPSDSGVPFSVEASQGFVAEVEPNPTFTQATTLGGTDVVATGNIFPNGDVDFWSFTATAGDRVYAATMTSFSANASSDSVLALIAPDGSTIIETDDDDGFLGASSSSIAGATLTGTGTSTYYVRVRHFSATNQLRPYHLHLRVQSGSAPATSETDPTPGTGTGSNNTAGEATPLPADGWISGTRGSNNDLDFFSISLNAGDTVFASLDTDHERDGTTWNGRLGVGLFGDTLATMLLVDDTNTVSPNSEAVFGTVKAGGTYYLLVDSSVASGGSTFTYHLSVSVHPATPQGVNCTTHASTDVPQTIPTTGSVGSTITVPGNPRIADLDVSIELNHAFVPDLDVHLRSPAGNSNGLFTDAGSNTFDVVNTTIDDEAGIPVSVSATLNRPQFQPEPAYRLSWFDGEDAGGTWTLDIRDDAAGNGGTLTAWSLTICEPAAPPACAGTPVTAYSSDFETDTGSFTHSGTADEWERGLPTFAPITTCNSGTKCWKTDLDNTYGSGSNQDLLSPGISLSGLTGPIRVSWAQTFQMESASLDHASVDVQEFGGTNPTRLFEWLDATMTDLVGSPAVAIQESAGWGLRTSDIGSYANKNVQLKFHLDSDTATNLAGLGIDDVTVTACCTPASCNDGNPCADDICDSAQGCIHVNNTSSCDDGNPCTSGDVCSGGSCQGSPNSGPCSDGNPCTSGDVCISGSCQGSPNNDPCSDGEPCTSDDLCSGGSCQGSPNNNPCSDGDPCTLNDQCAGGACLGGPPPSAVQICNTGSISIPSFGAAAPYPSNISVADQGVYLCAVTVDLNGVTHSFPNDIDLLLVGPGGQNAIIMSDVGGATDVTGVNLTLSDAAATSLSDAGPLVSGTFKPTNVGTGDTFPGPAPAPSGGSALSVFTGTDPNGSWQLFVADDAGGDSGSLSGGWCLDVVAVCSPAPPAVTDVDPPDGSENQSGATNIVVTFSEPVNPATVSSTTFRLLDGAIPIGASRSVAPSGLQATLDPSGPLSPGVLYTVEVTSGVLDLCGQAATTFTSSFRADAASTSGGTPLPPSTDQTTPPPNPAQARTGSVVSAAGDLNGDGFQDFITGGPGYQHPVSGNVEAGVVIVYLGSATASERRSPDIIFRGELAHDRAGVSVAGNFDFDGDGRKDLLIGAEQVDRTSLRSFAPTGPGKVYLIYFDPANYPFLSDPDVPDIVDLSSVGGSIPGVVFTGVASGDGAGFAVAGGGRVNPGSGQDILIGAPGRSSRTGAAYLIFDALPRLTGVISLGRVANGLGDQIAGIVYEGAAAGDGLGSSVAFPGDVTDTAGDDLAMGAPGSDPLRSDSGQPADAGTVYVAQGGSLSTGTVLARNLGCHERPALCTCPDPYPCEVYGAQFQGSQAGESLGFSVAGGGDNQVDGVPDLLMGAPLYEPPGETTGATFGRAIQASVRAGKGIIEVDFIGELTETLGSVPGVVWTGASAGDRLGYSVAGLGDINGDGFDDIALGAPLADPSPGLVDAGTAYLVEGAPTPTPQRGVVSVATVGSTTAGQRRIGTQAGEHAGSSLAGTGDLDGRGFRDVAVGAPEHTSGVDANAGTVYLIRLDDNDGDGTLDTEDCDPADDQLWSVPGEVQALLFSSDEITLTWAPPVERGAAASVNLLYDTARSTSPSDFGAAATCLETDGLDTSSTDATAPAAGNAFYYLVRAENGCGPGPPDIAACP